MSVILREKELENTHIVDEYGNKLNNLESQKNDDHLLFQEQLTREREQRQKYANQCSDLLRIIEMKDRQIKEMKGHGNQSQ